MKRFLLPAILWFGSVCAGFAALAADPVAAAFRPLPLEGMENTFSVGKRLYSGSSPENEAAFAALEKLGVKTIVSVDGTVPDAAAAQRHGMRYIHLPFGYDGIPSTNALRLAKAVATVDGPIYFHCHHGKHRGPAAVAVVCEALDGWKPDQADAWLRAAGTSTNYAGLFRSVAEFKPPTAAELAAVPADFPARAPTPALVDAMVRIDGHADALELARKSGFTAPKGNPDLVPSAEALQLLELFREARRTGLGARRGPRHDEGLARAEEAAARLLEAIRSFDKSRTAPNLAAAEKSLAALKQSCVACHKAERD